MKQRQIFAIGGRFYVDTWVRRRQLRPDPEEQLIDAKEVGRRLSLTEQTVGRWWKESCLPRQRCATAGSCAGEGVISTNGSRRS